MAKANPNTTKAPNADQWTVDTADYFSLRIDGARCVLTALISNMYEFEPLNGRASDDAICMTIQHVANVVENLEKLTYRFDDHQGFFNLPLHLMWARGMLQVLDEMFGAENWEININSKTVGGYLAAVERVLADAELDVIEIHASRFPGKSSQQLKAVPA